MNNTEESEVQMLRRKLREAELDAKWHEQVRETLEIEAKTAFLNHESVLEALEKERRLSKRLQESLNRALEYCIPNNLCHDGYNVDIHVAETVKTLREEIVRMRTAMTEMIEGLPKNKAGKKLREKALQILREQPPLPRVISISVKGTALGGLAVDKTFLVGE